MTMASGIASSNTPATAGQIKEIVRMGEDAFEAALQQAGLFHHSAQAIIENGGKFKQALLKAELEIIKNELYKNRYPTKSIEQQIALLRMFFPGIENFNYKTLPSKNTSSNPGFSLPFLGSRPTNSSASPEVNLFDSFINQEMLKGIEEGSISLNDEASGWYVFPHWSIIAASYLDAVKVVFSLLKQANDGAFEYPTLEKYKTANYKYHTVFETKLKEQAITKLQQNQRAKMLLLPVQFGVDTTNRPVTSMDQKNFGLGLYETGIILLTHPEYLERAEDPRINMFGDSFIAYHPAHMLGGAHEETLKPGFFVRDNKLRFNGSYDDIRKPQNNHTNMVLGYFPTM